MVEATHQVTSLEVGVALGLMHDAKAEARWAEAAGFDYLVTGEHLAFHVATANNFVSLAAAAGATESIKLMSGIVLVPLYPAALLAKQTAMLDVVSGGRFSLGIGVGGEYPREFAAVGVPVNERGARTDEALEVLDLLLTGDRVSFDGRFTQLDDITISPKPIQKPRVPIWVAGRKEAAMRRVARFGEGWLPYMYTPEMLADSLEQIRSLAAEAGRPDGAVRGGLYAFACVHDDRETALELASEQLSRQYNQDFSQLVGKYAIAGDPDDCVRQLRAYQEAGAETVVLGQGCPERHRETNLELLASAVLPALRS